MIIAPPFNKLMKVLACYFI